MQTASEPPLRMPRHFKKSPQQDFNVNTEDINAPWDFYHRPKPLDINLKLQELNNLFGKIEGEEEPKKPRKRGKNEEKYL